MSFPLRLAVGVILVSLSASPAKDQWVPMGGVDGGEVLDLALDGTRICAATFTGIYCRGPADAEWLPTFLVGKLVQQLAKTRTGWAAIVSERIPDSAATIRKAYLSSNGGTDWIVADWLPVVGSWQEMRTYGDTLLRSHGENMELSGDAGLTWKTISPPPPAAARTCLPTEGSLLCVTEDNVYRKTAAAASEPWRPLRDSAMLGLVHYAPGRVYVEGLDGVLSEYGPSGLERSLPALPGFKILLASDSLVVARSPDEVAYLRGRETVWTRQAAPFEYMPFRHSGGVWTDWAAVALSFLDSPQKVRFTAGGVAFDPFSLGLHDAHVKGLASDGRSLLAQTLTALWRRDPAGNWNVLHRREPWIARFWIQGGQAVVATHPVYEGTPPASFSSDSGRTWQEQPGSLPGVVYDFAQVGGIFLALSNNTEYYADHSIRNRACALYEAKAWTGPWSLRKDNGEACGWDLHACGNRLFSEGQENFLVSQDTGRTWAPTGMKRIFPAQGPRLYALDTLGNLLESPQCGDAWIPVQVPWSGRKEVQAVNTAGDQPLAAVFDRDRQDASVYPLPGASPDWIGIEDLILPGPVNALLLHEGVLYAGLEHWGLYALDAPSTRIAPGSRPVPSVRNPSRFRGWRRIDGRAVPASAGPPRTPLFPSGQAPRGH